jgi:hypothetical protein
MGQVHGTKIEVDPRFKKSAPITKEAIDFIKRHTAGTTLLEIGCGSGIYADLLRKSGVKVIATDACRIKKEGLLPPNSRMADFTNKRAIGNIIEKNAVEAVQNYGQNTSISLFLSFPLPGKNDDELPYYDEISLRNFKGNKFFLIAMYKDHLSNTKNYNKSIPNMSTGSFKFHNYLAKEWNVKDKLLLETGRMGEDSHIYLIYFERKTENNSNNNRNNFNNNRNNSNQSGGTNRKCPKNNAKDFKLKTVDIGLDGNLWIVSKRSDCIKFWKRK